MAVQNATTAQQGGFGWGSLGDVFLTGVNKYMNIREAEKMAEITGEAQLANNQAIEVNTQPQAQVQGSPSQNQQAPQDNQWINGVDNKVILFGGVGALALLLILKK